jgi:hypothetical protein
MMGAVALAKDRWDSSVEVRLLTGAHSAEDARPMDEPRRIHASRPGTVIPACSAARYPLLPTFEKWTKAARPGVELCDDCARLVPAFARRIPNPHLRRAVLTATGTQWVYMLSPGIRWTILITGPMLLVPFPWRALRLRLIIDPDGVSIVTWWRRRSFSWNEIARFDPNLGNASFLLVVPRTGHLVTAPIPHPMFGSSKVDATHRAAQLNQVLLGR